MKYILYFIIAVIYIIVAAIIAILSSILIYVYLLCSLTEDIKTLEESFSEYIKEIYNKYFCFNENT